MRQSCELSANAIAKCMQASQPGIHEHLLAAKFGAPPLHWQSIAYRNNPVPCTAALGACLYVLKRPSFFDCVMLAWMLRLLLRLCCVLWST